MKFLPSRSSSLAWLMSAGLISAWAWRSMTMLLSMTSWKRSSSALVRGTGSHHSSTMAGLSLNSL